MEVLISTLQKHQGKRDSACKYLAWGPAQQGWGWHTICEGKVGSLVSITLCPLGSVDHRDSSAALRQVLGNGLSLRKPSA